MIISSRAHWIAVATLLLGAGCDEPTVRPPDDVIWQLGTGQMADATVATPVSVTANIVPNDAYANVPVHWSVSGGILSTTDTVAGPQGTASVTWTPPTAAGMYEITLLIAGRHTKTFQVEAQAGPVTRATFAVDSIRLTRMGSRKVRVRTFDQYDNEHEHTPPSELSCVADGPFFCFAVVDSLIVGASGTAAKAPGTAILKTYPGVEIETLKVAVDIVIASVTLSASSPLEVGIGESMRFPMVTKDSGGFTVVGSPAELGVTFSSADAGVATVDSDGMMTGAAVGATNIVATYGGNQTTANLSVVKSYDFGTLLPMYDVPELTLHTWVEGPAFTPNGRSVLNVMQSSGCCPQTATLSWYRVDGSKAATKTLTGNPRLIVGPSNTFLVSTPLTAYDSVGNQLWTQPYSGVSFAADDSIVVHAQLNTVRAFSPSGALLWTYTAPGSQGANVTVAPSRIYVTPFQTGVTALNRAGATLWTSSISPTLTDDQSWLYASLFISTGNFSVKALDPDGIERWTIPISAPGSFFLKLAPGSGNRLFILGGSELRAVDRTTGTEQWRVPAPYGELGIVGNKVLVGDAFVHVFDAATGEKLGRSTTRLAGSHRMPPKCTGAGLGLPATRKAYLYSKCE